jgi:hypothetical protein
MWNPMLRAPVAAIAVLASIGCGAAGGPRDPAVVALPAVPTSSGAAAAAPSAPTPAAAKPSLGCDASFPTEGMTWREKHVTNVDLRAAGSCQVQPMRRTRTTSFDATLLEVRARAASTVKLDILDDVDDAQGWPSLPSLTGKHYVLVFADKGAVTVTTAEGAPVAEEEAQRVRTLVPAGAVTGLDPDLVGRMLRARGLKGRTIPTMSQWLQGVAQPVLRDEIPQTPSSTATLLVTDGIEFEVSLSTSEGGAGMCHQWTTTAQMTGALRLRPSDGALVSLHAKGPAEDTEATCAAGGTGGPGAPRTCNRGEASFDIERPCFGGAGP